MIVTFANRSPITLTTPPVVICEANDLLDGASAYRGTRLVRSGPHVWAEDTHSYWVGGR
ncbi:MAG TPA: hypothetical protein VFG68_08250 [Fimbriiglobus sp.]|nr:hypothetical protein [Fimbriiglobus sp.]